MADLGIAWLLFEICDLILFYLIFIAGSENESSNGIVEKELNSSLKVWKESS